MPGSVTLKSPINALKGVGTKRAEQFHKLGVDTVYSLLRYYPRRYINYTEYLPIAQTVIGENNVVRARVYQKSPESRIRKGLSLYKVFVTDDETEMVITIFNSKYMYEALKLGQEYVFYGKVTGNLFKREMNAPSFVPYTEQMKMMPIYSLTEGLSNKMIASAVETGLRLTDDAVFDPIPADITENYGLCHLNFALHNIHFPENQNALETARKRLVFEELLTLQLGMLLLKKRNREESGVSIKEYDWSGFEALLPFSLTGAQKRVIADCVEDFHCTVPMNRLVQGDVGSGKTMVAAALGYLMAKNGYQTAVMAPTEILSEQHYRTFCRTFENTGIRVCLLTGSLTKSVKEKETAKIAAGEYDVIIGTHALIQDSVQFDRLGLVVTDEQHRFGVAQRSKLAAKGENPHLLVMSATPIPRTLGLIIYGDLDISVIDELPAGRQKIDTMAITGKKRERALHFIREQLDRGLQGYIVCPLIAEEGESELKSVTGYAAALEKGPLRGCRIEILHGKMKAKEKDAVMERFKQGKTQLLVSTTVIEVGVDVPNAVIMMIENAERYGLSQLHQLRGRVGRGSEKSYCILISDNTGEDSRKRLKTLCETSDGFRIAEEDLKLRGPGDFFGARQHGLPDLKIADMAADMEILKQTQQLAKRILEKDVGLRLPENKGLRRLVSLLFAHGDGQFFH